MNQLDNIHYLHLQGSNLHRQEQGVPEGPMDSPHTPTQTQPAPLQTTFFTSSRLNRRQAPILIEEVVEAEESQAVGEEEEAEGDATGEEESEVAGSEEEVGAVWLSACSVSCSVLPQFCSQGPQVQLSHVYDRATHFDCCCMQARSQVIVMA